MIRYQPQNNLFFDFIEGKKSKEKRRKKKNKESAQTKEREGAKCQNAKTT
jgi:hypothetical protein